MKLTIYWFKKIRLPFPCTFRHFYYLVLKRIKKENATLS